MPNHVTSRCRIVGPTDAVDRFRSSFIRPAPSHHSDHGALLFDFDAIIPMPASVRDADSSNHAQLGMTMIVARGSSPAPFSNLGLYENEIQWVRNEAMLPRDASIEDVAIAFLAKHPDIETKGQSRLKALTETGYVDWYSWSIARWGTKWGAYRYREVEAEDYTFLFETAWSFPTPIFTKLAADIPDLSFECATHDEGSCFAGQGWFNPPAGELPFTIGKATDELYERVHGHPCPVEDDE